DIGGDKTQSTRGKLDYWIVKTDAAGNKKWDKRFGGTDNDYLYSVQQTTDGGYILGGYSWSDAGGDKGFSRYGYADYWIIKTDSGGNMLWSIPLGGTGNDELYSVKQTADGGYIAGGYSFSDVGYSKSQPCWGSNDYWVVKLDYRGI